MAFCLAHPQLEVHCREIYIHCGQSLVLLEGKTITITLIDISLLSGRELFPEAYKCSKIKN